MASTIRIRAIASDDVVNFKALIRHPMDSGFVKDSEGNVIPEHYIEVVTVKVADKTVFTANWGPAVSKDPYLEFKFKGAAKGDTVALNWVDNEGESDSATAEIM